MATRGEETDEVTPLLDHGHPHVHHAHRSRSRSRSIDTASSILSSRLSRDELALADTAVGERLPYDAYQTIDWLHDLVRFRGSLGKRRNKLTSIQTKDAFRYRRVKSQKGIRAAFRAAYEDYQGWLVAGLVGLGTAFVASFTAYTESTFGDVKFGYCRHNRLYGREACCFPKEACADWVAWSASPGASFAIYAAVAWALAMGAGIVTKLTRTEIPAFATHEARDAPDHAVNPRAPNKVIYMAAGSGIPEIKLLLSGYEFPHLLSLRVLVVKTVGASLAVASGLCLGKEGPFVHISTSAGYVVARMFPQFRENGRRMREMLSVACSSALAVAFGSPVGGVLFVYEEMSSQFPRKVLWKAFLCSMVAAMSLKALDPTRTGRLVLFETNYGVAYKPHNYIFFVLLGVAGGLFGAAFCKGGLMWTKRMKPFINRHPLVELTIIVLATAALQYPNPITREPALLMIKNLLRDCEHKGTGWICEQERREDKTAYYCWLAYGSVVKVVMTILTAGSPSQFPRSTFLGRLG